MSTLGRVEAQAGIIWSAGERDVAELSAAGAVSSSFALAGFGVELLPREARGRNKVRARTNPRRTLVAGAHAMRPWLAHTLTSLPSREVFVAELVTSEVPPCGCKGNPGYGSKGSSCDRATHPPERLAARNRATRQPLGQLVEGGLATRGGPRVTSPSPTLFVHQACSFPSPRYLAQYALTRKCGGCRKPRIWS